MKTVKNEKKWESDFVTVFGEFRVDMFKDRLYNKDN